MKWETLQGKEKNIGYDIMNKLQKDINSQSKQRLVELYFKAKFELKQNEYNLSKNFSKTLLRECYSIVKLLTNLETIIGTDLNQIP